MAYIFIQAPQIHLLLAIILSIIFHFIYNPFFPSTLLWRIFIDTISINVTLAIFNLVPIHPLDGGKIFIGLLPNKDAIEAENFMNRFGLIILILLIFPIFGKTAPLNLVISPIINFIINLLIPGTGSI